MQVHCAAPKFHVVRLKCQCTEQVGRIATLTAERPDWEDWKKQQKEKAAKAQLAADEEDRQMQEYRAQLDADRNARLARGTNNAHLMVWTLV